MRLDNKRAEDVTASDIVAFVESHDAEEQRLDFKQQPYGGTSSDKREMLRDFVAMANAGGGYIVIGIAEDDRGRATHILPVQNASQEVERMQDLAATGIAPKIIPLQIRCITTGHGEVILVRIPESANTPHMVSLQNRTEFRLRHGTIKREMSVDEIRAAFIGDEQQRRLGRIEETLARLHDDRHRERFGAITPDTPISMLSTVTEVRHAMDLQAKEQLGDKPYYRATVTPTSVDTWMSLTDKVLDLVRNPVATRPGGWHIWELSLRRTRNGVVGTNSDGHEVILLGNGHMEFRHPLRHRSYQWRQSEGEAEKHPWLYPYPLMELPISFFRSARRVYAALAVDCPAKVTHSFLNFSGFILEPGHPANAFFGMDGVEYEEEEYYGETTVSDASNFDPDALVYELMEEFYAAFGFSANTIPLFDEDHHFQP